MIPGGVLAPKLNTELLNFQRSVFPPVQDLFCTAHMPMIESGKTLGWWAKMGWVGFFAGRNGAHLTNVKNSTQKALEVGTPGVVDEFGWQGDGATTYIDTQRTPTQLGMTANGVDAFLSSLVYCQTDIPGISGLCGASGRNTGAVRARSGAVMSVWPAGVAQLTKPVNSGVGFQGVFVNGGQIAALVRTNAYTSASAPMPAVGTTTFRYARIGAGAARDPNKIAYGFAGAGLTVDQVSDIYDKTVKVLQSLNVFLEEPVYEGLGPNNAFVEDVLTTTPGAYAAGHVIRLIPPPVHDGQTNYAQYGRVHIPTNIGFALNDSLLDAEIWAKPDEGQLDFTLQAASAANKYKRMILRKSDYTNGVVQCNGATINRQFDVLIFLSTGTAWIQNNARVPQRRVAGNSPIWDGSNNFNATPNSIDDNGLHCITGATNRTVTLPSAATTSEGFIGVVRKMDTGVGTVTVQPVGTVLANKFDYMVFTVTGGVWVADPTLFVDIGDTVWDVTTNEYFVNEYDYKANVQVAPGPGPGDRIVWLPDPAGSPAGTIVCIRREAEYPPQAANVQVKYLATGAVAGTLIEPGQWLSFQNIGGAAWIDVSATVYPQELGYVFPITECVGRPSGALWSRATRPSYCDFVWMPRALGRVAGEITAFALKGNDTQQVINILTGPNKGQQGRTEFDTDDLAMGELWTKLAYTLGYTARNDPTFRWFDNTYRASGWGFLDMADHMGYNTRPWDAYLGDPDTLYKDVNVNLGAVGHWAYFNANAETIFTQNAVGGGFKVTRNVIILPRARSSDVAGRGYLHLKAVAFDSEAADNRPPEQFVRTCRGINRICHAKGVQTYSFGHTPSSTGQVSGWRQENAHDLVLGPPNPHDGLDENWDRIVLISNSTPTVTWQAMVAQIFQQANFFTGTPVDDTGVGPEPIPWEKFFTELRMGANLQEISVEKLNALISLRNQHNLTECVWTNNFGQFGGFMTRVAQQRVAKYYQIPIVLPPGAFHD